MTGRLLSLVIPLTVVLIVAQSAACGGDDPPPADDAVADTAVSPDTAAPADTVEGTRCCPLGNCPVGNTCTQGACLPTAGAGQCYLDGQCLAGQVCSGAALCECGEVDCTPAVGQCGYPEGCCNGDGDCGAEALCVAGQCQPRASAGCWRDDQCKAGEACEGQTLCPCGATDCEPAAGHCGLPGVCCIGDAECGSGGRCEGGGCVAAPEGDACYQDDDCEAGQSCRGDYLCACGAEDGCAVPTTEGACLGTGAPCCRDNSDCESGDLCVEGRGCFPAPEADRCWVDGHCGLGRVCDDAQLCACTDDACEDALGTCRTLPQACTSDAECGVAMRCVVPDALICPDSPTPDQGVCVPRVDDRCWTSADCPHFERCSGEVICTDPEGCERANEAGVCRDKVAMRDCCSSHDECAPGLECRNSNSSMTCPPDISSVCLPAPVFGETCWNALDCPDGNMCSRVIICGCNGKCRWFNQGSCEVPTNCTSNAQCGTDSVCARDPECIASPCTTTATCNQGGRCQLKVEGRCWTHDECGAGNYCEGLRVCPADTECPAPDSPGLCAPRAELGECCTSYRGCEGGLRCVSVGARSGCFIDITSVCVPAVTFGTDCFADDDCGPGQRCEGAAICPCGVDSCTGPPLAGSCVATLP